MYQPRTYRSRIRDKDLVSFNVTVKETDLFIRATANLQSKACRFVYKYRDSLEKYIGRFPDFLTSLEPVTVDGNAPQIVRAMAVAAATAGVGPMAAVAGAIADFVGRELLAFSPEIIIENGGDIFLKSRRKRVIGLYAGSSPLSGKIGLEIAAKDTPVGICTSSGTTGHSLSFGKADAAVVLAPTAALADAAATAVGNRVKKSDDISRALEIAHNIPGLIGTVIVVGDKIGVRGRVKICTLAPGSFHQPEFFRGLDKVRANFGRTIAE